VSAAAELESAIAALRPRLAEWTPEIALVLGSGLGSLAAEIAEPLSIPFAEIPGLGATRVEGHTGRVVIGSLCGSRVMAFAGRRHVYEGVEPSRVVLPVRLASALGATRLLVTNAAGGIRRTFAPGTLMLIRDHINFTFRSPLAGAVLSGEDRFPDLSAPYDETLCAAMREAARSEGVVLDEGVYAAVLGPSYETPAEIRMLERLGADAVGMSTVPEVIVAAARGMRACGVSCITNAAAGSGAPLDHREVLAVATRVRSEFAALVRAWLARVSPSGTREGADATRS
jgi:purine-nucleoside phosphorylase